MDDNTFKVRLKEALAVADRTASTAKVVTDSINAQSAGESQLIFPEVTELDNSVTVTKKRGRKPKAGGAMTPAERQKAYRQREKDRRILHVKLQITGQGAAIARKQRLDIVHITGTAEETRLVAKDQLYNCWLAIGIDHGWIKDPYGWTK